MSSDTKTTTAQLPGGDRLLTEVEAADLLSIRPQTLSVWRATGRYPGLPFTRIGRSVRYRHSHLQAFIESRTSEGGESKSQPDPASPQKQGDEVTMVSRDLLMPPEGPHEMSVRARLGDLCVRLDLQKFATGADNDLADDLMVLLNIVRQLDWEVEQLRRAARKPEALP